MRSDKPNVPTFWPAEEEHRRLLGEGWQWLEEETWSDYLALEERIETLEGLPTGIQGTYDQINDSVLQGVGAGSPLPAASAFTAGEYFTLDAGTGLFTTPLSELNGRNGTTGDQVIATAAGTWLHIGGTGDYLSSVVDDTAKGSIRFDQPAYGLVAAVDPNDYIRKGESESDDAATLGAAQSYADAGDAAVQGNLNTHIADQGNPHVVAHSQLADRGTNTHAQIDAHIADPGPHWDDAPANGIAYVRRDNDWTTKTNLAVLVGPPSNATLGTGGFRLVNWADGGSFGNMIGSHSTAAGSITIPADADGLYNFAIAVYGDQGNDNKEESIWLQLEIVGGPNAGIVDVAHESVDTDKTSARSLHAFGTRQAYAGQVIYVRMRASTGLGTFNFNSATFEIDKKI